jgi:hypothetical protein
LVHVRDLQILQLSNCFEEIADTMTGVFMMDSSRRRALTMISSGADAVWCVGACVCAATGEAASSADAQTLAKTIFDDAVSAFLIGSI